MESKKKKDQFVVAYLPDLDKTQACLDYALQFAKILDKGLILLHISDDSLTQITTEQAEKRLKEINESLPENVFHSYVALKGKSESVLNAIGELLNAVLTVVCCDSESKDKKKADHPQTLLRNLASSRTAYLVCSAQSRPQEYEKVVLTLNHLSESKEKTLWASYLGRFADSNIVLYYRRYKDEYYQKQLNLNIAFARKMFTQFGIEIETKHSLDTKTKLDLQALEYAEKENCNLIICQTTKNKTFVDMLTGLDEVKVLKQIKNIPILFLNPREDLFILCE